jgi:cytochrome c peroxidase
MRSDPTPPRRWGYFLIAGVSLACQEGALPNAIEELPTTESLDAEAIYPIPLPSPLDARRVALGEKLFHDTMLSMDRTISCASCHSLRTGGADQRSTALGINGAVGPINSPTVFNCALNFQYFWDGRAATLEEQVNGPVSAESEMGGASWELVVERAKKDDHYPTTFAAIYQDGITPDNIRNAIATYERSLTTPNSPFDRYLRGDKEAISVEAEGGYRMFIEYGCASCHQGVGIGGNMYQVFGVMGDYFAERGNVNHSDLGRYNVTQQDEDKFVFRVPSLRNVARTGPYFHDGLTNTLESAVRVMARYQLGRELDGREVKMFVAFLESLTGEYQGRSL